MYYTKSNCLSKNQFVIEPYELIAVEHFRWECHLTGIFFVDDSKCPHWLITLIEYLKRQKSSSATDLMAMKKKKYTYKSVEKKSEQSNE